MRPTRIVLSVLICALTGAAQTGFSVDALDRKVSPCDDFYQFACGGWLKSNPIPADQSTWGRFSELHERNQKILRDILETSSAKTTRGPLDQKIGDYFGACMDEKGIESKGTTPLKPFLDRIAGLSDKKQLTGELIRLHSSGVGPMFGVASAQDLKNAEEVIADIDQGGISLPERDYYFKEDAKSVELRKAFVAHVRKMFELTGDPAETAAAKANTVMAIETALAKGHLDVVARRDPNKLYHRLSIAELA
ncbi:MAG: M13 family peptidase, partial [Bryobacteraceae bacterium]|nr:M13 family peptidase [Bryobacteraceae bacterium]